MNAATVAQIASPSWLPANAIATALVRSFLPNPREIALAPAESSMLCPKPKIMRSRNRDVAALARGRAIVETPQTREPAPITTQAPKRSTTGPRIGRPAVYDQFHPERM
ncbi:MAG: hypothetical protein DME36_01070 [Verrucomicrobia bacterium]|nr:MAG: hypothetical protein DME36_01070 [Verrucomicrobiota bacterium]